MYSKLTYRFVVGWLPLVGSVATKRWYGQYQRLVLTVPKNVTKSGTQKIKK